MVMDLNYFEVTWDPDAGDAIQLARPLGHSREFSDRSIRPGIVDDPPDLTWTWASRDHPPGDFVPELRGLRLVSPKVKEIFDAHRTPADALQWIQGTIIGPDGSELPHWVAHFPEHYDFLDHDRSTFGPSGLPVLRVLSAAKLAPHAVTLMSRLSFTFLLAERVVDDLQSAGCQGLLYMPVSMAP